MQWTGQQSEFGRVFDISPLIHSGIAVFPGDQNFERKVLLDCAKGDVLTLSSINTTVHVGAHVDAPSHYSAGGKTMQERPLDLYLGKAQVLRVDLPRGERIRVSHLQGAVIQAPRVLFHTGSFPNPDKWNGDFNALSDELVEYLARRQVKLVGIDTPSIDPADDKTLESHHAVLRNDMAILEGIVLAHIPDGTYTLMALPLPLKDADASPVRAVLIERKAESGK